MRISTTFLAAGMLLAASSAAAQTSETAAQTGETQFRAGMDLLTSGIRPGAADSAGIGHRAYGIQFNGSMTAYRVLTISAEGGVVGMSDEAAFTQETNQGTKTSSVSAGIGSISAGLHIPPVSLGGTRPAMLSAGVNAGHSFLHVTRTIGNCVDCHGEDVNIRAGSFWEPVVMVAFGPGAVSARYRTYVNGSDFNDALMIGYSIVPAKRAKPAEEPAELPAPPAR